MSAALAIAAREIRERRVLLLAALAVGMLPTLAWYLPGMQEPGNAEIVAVFVCMAFPAAAALAVGTSIIGRDLAEGRLAFYLARPISELSLWAGKFLGGFALVGLAFVLVVAPFNVVSGNVRHWLADGRIPFQLIIASAFLLVLMTAAHAAASFYRSRSAWIVADILLFGLVLAASQRLMVRMLDAGAGEAMVERLPLVFAGGTAVALLASAVQLVVGRADPARGRRALSWTLWLGAGLYVLGLHVAGSWMLGTTPAETGISYGSAAPRGAGLVVWAGTSGRAGYRPVFAMDGSSGAFASFSAERGGMPVFTEDGRRALWTADAAELAVERRPSLVTASFDSSGPHIDAVPLGGFEGAPQLLALDPAGGRALVAGSGRAALLDTASGATIANLGGVDAGAGAFLPDGGIRLLANRVGVVVLDWNTGDGSTLERMRVAGVPGQQAGLFGVRGDLALVSPEGRDLVLLDVAAGRQTTLSRAPEHRRTHAFGAQAIGLAQGGLAVGLGNELWIISPAGEVAGHVELDAGVGILGLSQMAPDELAIGVLSPARTLFLEVPSGVARREAKGVRPAAVSFRRLKDVVQPGSLGSRLFVTEDDALVELMSDGSRRVIVPAVADE